MAAHRREAKQSTVDGGMREEGCPSEGGVACEIRKKGRAACEIVKKG